MKLKSVVVATLGFIAGVLLTSSSFVFADSNSGDNGNNVGGGADYLVGGYGKNNLTPPSVTNPFSVFYQNPYTTNEDQLASGLLNLLLVPFQTSNPTTNPNAKTQPNSGQTLTDYSIYQLLTTTKPITTIMNSLAIPAPLPGAQTQSGVNWITAVTGADDKNQQQIQPTASFSQDSLLLPSQYDQSSKEGTTPQQTAAQNFINFVTGQNNPDPVIDFSSVSQQKLAAALSSNPDPAITKYLSQLRTYAATQSIANSNLYFLYAERLPQSTKDLAKSIPQITSDPAVYPQASPLSVEQFLATYRYNTNSSWLSALGTMTPAQLQREQLALMRDLLFEEFQTHLVMERILTANTATQLATSATMKVQLQQLYNNALKSPLLTGSGN